MDSKNNICLCCYYYKCNCFINNSLCKNPNCKRHCRTNGNKCCDRKICNRTCNSTGMSECRLKYNDAKLKPCLTTYCRRYKMNL